MGILCQEQLFVQQFSVETCSSEKAALFPFIPQVDVWGENFWSAHSEDGFAWHCQKVLLALTVFYG